MPISDSFEMKPWAEKVLLFRPIKHTGKLFYIHSVHRDIVHHQLLVALKKSLWGCQQRFRNTCKNMCRLGWLRYVWCYIQSKLYVRANYVGELQHHSDQDVYQWPGDLIASVSLLPHGWKHTLNIFYKRHWSSSREKKIVQRYLDSWCSKFI